MAFSQALYEHIAIQAGYDDVAGFGAKSAANDQVVTIENTSAGHALAADLNHVGVRGTQTEQFIQGELVLM